MRRLELYVYGRFMLVIVLLVAAEYTGAEGDRYQAPFDSAATVAARDLLSLTDVLALVARANPMLRAFDWELETAQYRLQQAGLRPNPEFESEFEEVGWDAPGFDEMEITLMLSQELELFGQRGARKQLAQASINATALSAKLAAFDLYLDVKNRFYALVHAQRRINLADSSVALAKDIADNISYRIEKGAALPSELLLARLDLQRVELLRDEAEQGLAAAQVELAALWGGDAFSTVVEPCRKSDLKPIMEKLPALVQHVDSSRHMILLHQQAGIIRAEKNLAVAEAKPGITLSGGYRRLAANGSNSLLFGVSLPLPLFNRNQGEIAGFGARLRSLEHEQQSARLEATAKIRAGSARLTQLINRHSSLDTLLLPTAEEAYIKLKEAYEAGRIPYAGLLEAKRALIELRFEYNDMHLDMHETIIGLERITGAALL